MFLDTWTISVADTELGEILQDFTLQSGASARNRGTFKASSEIYIILNQQVWIAQNQTTERHYSLCKLNYLNNCQEFELYDSFCKHPVNLKIQSHEGSYLVTIMKWRFASYNPLHKVPRVTPKSSKP